MSKNWNVLDKFIAWVRYRRIDKYVAKYISKNDVVVDVGCGRNAEFLNRYKTRIKKGYGFDFRQHDHIEDNLVIFNNRNMKGLDPLENNSCDFVFLIAVLEHLCSPEFIFKEAHRVLKRQGIFILTTPSRLAKPLLEFMAFKIHIINEDEIKEHKHYYSKAELKDLYERFGFGDFHHEFFECGLNHFASGVKL